MCVYKFTAVDIPQGERGGGRAVDINWLPICAPTTPAAAAARKRGPNLRKLRDQPGL